MIIPDTSGTICVSTQNSNGLTLSASGEISINALQPDITDVKELI